MRKIFMKSLLTCIFMFGAIGEAKVITGQAYINNGNINVAREQAKRDAMRTFVEQEVGINVRSQSEMANFLVIKDVVSTNSEGFVLIKKWIKQGAQGDIYTVVLDLEHGNKPLESAPNDIAAQLENLADNCNRKGVDVALLDSNAKDTMSYSEYIAARLNKAGFTANPNDTALIYLRDNMSADDITINAGVRQAVRQKLDHGNALVRGRVSLARRAELVGKTYRAIAEIACQIVSYDDNITDSVSMYVDGFGTTPEMAERNAKEQALSKAVMDLAKAASITIQRGEKAQQIKTVLIFQGLTDRVNDPRTIIETIKSTGCSIFRSRLLPNGDFQTLVTYEAINGKNANQVARMVWEALRNTYSASYPQEDTGIGATKYIINLRG